jgi:prephenate dehydrogenase
VNINIKKLNKVVIFGVGLIGGSFALALKKHAAVKHIVGVGRSQSSLARAVTLGIIDVACSNLADALDGADLLLIAVPVAQTESIFHAIYPYLQKQTIVTDAGSTKGDVIAAARRILAEKIGQFVPAHPIAGAEHSGPEAAMVDLYQGKKVVITALPENTHSALHLVASVWQGCGAIPHYLNSEQHDQIFAAVSHLPHVLAFALMNKIAEQPEADLYFQYAASGFRDFTRIAGASPEMWRDITMANRDVLQAELVQYQAQLQQISVALRQANSDQLLAIFSKAQAARQRLICSSS